MTQAEERKARATALERCATCGHARYHHAHGRERPCHVAGCKCRQYQAPAPGPRHELPHEQPQGVQLGLSEAGDTRAPKRTA